MGEESDTEVNDCKIHFVKEVFQIPTVQKRVDQTAEDARLLKKGPATKRESAPYCVHCRDNPEKKCKICGCHECGSKENPDKQLMCDECDLPYHIYCLKPPLEEMPDVEEW
jgi:E3 ubiquitin-protein ligase UHRF1